MNITLDPVSPRRTRVSKVLEKPLKRVLNLVTYYKGELRPVVEVKFYRTPKTHYVWIAVWYSHDPRIEHLVGEGIAKPSKTLSIRLWSLLEYGLTGTVVGMNF